MNTKSKKPLTIGYWHSSSETKLPKPQNLQNPGWLDAEEKQRLAEYLKSGDTYETWRGFSYCRFHCQEDYMAMGCRDLTDGTWIWPEGLAHYIEAHHVSLPDRFIQHCRANHWKIPPGAKSMVTASYSHNHSKWIKLAANLSKKIK